jgi:DNA-binding LytR/AlgR family response regulator
MTYLSNFQINALGIDHNVFFIKDHNKITKMCAGNIVMVKANSNYSEIYLTDGKRMLTSKTLLHWERKMRGNPDIIRIHRSYLVNRRQIINISLSKSEVLLTCEIKALFSRRCRAKIKF